MSPVRRRRTRTRMSREPSRATISEHFEPRKCDKKRKASEMEDWREVTEKMTIAEQLQYMMENGIFTDCTFLVGPEDGKTHEFKAHRLLIARVSAVFEAMLLRGEMLEAKTGHVRVTDLSPDTFQLLLSSIYGKEPVMMASFPETRDLAFAADKYQMKLLLETCVARMCRWITPENIWDGFKTANLLRNEQLKQRCLQFLRYNALQCISDSGFMETSEENVALLLEQDELNVDDEQLLVNAVVHWARHAARQRGLSDDDNGVRAVLEPRLLKLFRFLAMSQEQFMLGPGIAGWLTDDEKDDINESRATEYLGNLPQHLSILTHKREKVNMFHPTLVKDLPRKICKRKIIDTRPNLKLTPSSHNCCKLTYTRRGMQNFLCLHATLIFRVKSSCKWLGFQYASRIDPINLTLDPTALLTNYPCYTEDFCAKACSYNLSLSVKSKKMNIGREKSYCQSTDHGSTVSVMFDGEAIPLVTDKWYVLEVVFKHDQLSSSALPGEYPNPSRATNVCTESGVEFVFHTERLDGYYTSKNDGIFEGIIFSV